jgi:hypothetical protein
VLRLETHVQTPRLLSRGPAQLLDGLCCVWRPAAIVRNWRMRMPPLHFPHLQMQTERMCMQAYDVER